ncbi:MAG: hypothetical protein EPN84_08300 [Legionella sp.]|nr:MAG: hypothetical protein EPN84_08300 [Legionella sp.]
MLKRSYSWILMVFLLASCAHHGMRAPAASTKPASNHSTQYPKVSAFSKVDVQGRFNVSLHTGYKQPQVILRGDYRDLIQVKTVVMNNTLHLSLGKGFPHFGAVNAEIHTNSLTSVRYVGAGTITGPRLYTRWLDLYLTNPGTTRLDGTIGLRHLEVNGGGLVQINGVSSRSLEVHFTGTPKVQLNGFVNLTSLELDGGGWLSLYWIKSDRLVIKAKKRAKIQLAGKVNRLEVELWDKANFKGRYLRANRTFVKTHDKSVAEISSVKHQSSLATDASDIYYYNLPDTRADFMAFNGSVLDMREWSQHDYEEFTRYNKQFP